MPCLECTKAISEGYAYWCSICTTFIPSNTVPVEEEPVHVCSPDTPCPDTSDRAGIILLNTKGELLLVRGPTGKLSLPKGKKKVCETNYEGACRECLEESGIDVKGMSVVHEAKIQGVVYFYVYYTGPLDATLSSVNSSEIQQVKWWKVKQDGVKTVGKTFKLKDVLDAELFNEYSSKRCNISLEALLQNKKFYRFLS